MKLYNLIIALILVTASSFTTTPEEIIAFNAEKANNAVMITWTPSIKPTTNHFEIQKSEDGVNWKVIAIMFPFEDVTEEHSYKYNDKTSVQNKSYYRIRQIDINKKENFSKVKMLSNAVSEK